MCVPIAMAAATTAMSAASSIMGFIGQNQASQENKEAANLGYAATANESAEQATQIDQQQSENTMNAVIARVASQGRISASAASLGGGAESTTAQQNAAAFASGRDLSVEDINSEGQRLQVMNQLNAADMRRRTQIASVQPASPLSLILGLGGDALKGATEFSQLGGRFGPSAAAAGA